MTATGACNRRGGGNWVAKGTEATEEVAGGVAMGRAASVSVWLERAILVVATGSTGADAECGLGGSVSARGLTGGSLVFVTIGLGASGTG